MSLIPWRPFRDLDNIFDDGDWFLPLVSKNKNKELAFNLYETDKEVVAEVGIPGINPDKIDIDIRGDILEVKGNQEDEKEEKNKNYWHKEIYRSSFERSIKLPTSINDKKVDAVYENGILKIVMPKKKEKETKTKIKVKKK